MHISIIYWSGTGNTEAMAKAVKEGADGAGAETTLLLVSEANAASVSSSDAVALGCPAMGAEVLEESEMEPFVASLGKDRIGGKRLALFGSYDWGDGQWMRDWERRMADLGAVLLAPGVTANNLPSEDDLAKCRELGASLAR